METQSEKHSTPGQSNGSKARTRSVPKNTSEGGQLISSALRLAQEGGMQIDFYQDGQDLFLILHGMMLSSAETPEIVPALPPTQPADIGREQEVREVIDTAQ